MILNRVKDFTCCVSEKKSPINRKCPLYSARDPDPFDPQDFGFLDPDPDPQKYSDPRIRIQGAKYQPKLQKKCTLKTQI